jgi:class 3 adenylate cyclase
MDGSPKRARGLSLRLSMAAAFVGVVLLTSVLLGTQTYLSVRSFIREDLRRRLGEVAALAAQQVQAPRHSKLRTRADEDAPAYREVKEVLKGVRDRVEGLRFVYTMRRQPDGRVVFVVDAEEEEGERSHVGDPYESPTEDMLAAFEAPHRVRVERRFTRDRWGTWLSGFAPVLAADGSLEAIVGVDVSAAEVLAYERRLLVSVVLAGAVVCAVVILIALWVSTAATRSMVDLEREMARIQRFDLAGETEFASRIVEISSMRNTLNHMRQGLRSFRRYVPADLVGELIRLGKEAALEVERRELTIFFSDIAGFTTAAERMAPDDLLRNLGEYLEGLTEIILKHRGTVDKFIGDGIMAFWGAPNPAADHATRACLAAVDCQDFLRKAAEGWKGRGLSQFPTRIGINAGEVLVGNVGYEERLNYTVIGDAVNVAGRLEQLNKQYGTAILVGESVYERAKDAVEARRIDRVALKGKTLGIAIYEVLARKGGPVHLDAEALRLFREGSDLYFQRSWAEALARFEEACRRAPDDRPSQVFAERCRRFVQSPPPADWDGVTILHEK